jgi:ABC-type glycerol-3-phosphate transport system permease component
MAPSDDRKPLAVGLGIWAQSTTMGGGAGTGGTQVAGNGIVTVTDVVTGAMMVSVPIIILFIALRRYWASGFLGGGLKG